MMRHYCSSSAAFLSFCILIIGIGILFLVAVPPSSFACGCSCSSSATKCDCAVAVVVTEKKCEDKSPLCARVEALCENFFFNQWQDLRCACPKTCKLCTENDTDATMLNPASQRDPVRCDPDTNPMDVVLVLDGSSSIGITVFNQQILGFAANLADNLGVTSNGHRLGVVQYASSVRAEIRLGQYNDTDTLKNAIGRIRYLQGGTRTGYALDWTRNQMFDQRNANKVCIVITDGGSDDSVGTPASRLRQMGVRMFAIGVGQSYNQAQLNEIANDASHVYTVDSFDQLNNTLAQSVNTMACADARQQQQQRQLITNI